MVALLSLNPISQPTTKKPLALILHLHLHLQFLLAATTIVAIHLQVHLILSCFLDTITLPMKRNCCSLSSSSSLVCCLFPFVSQLTGYCRYLFQLRAIATVFFRVWGHPIFFNSKLLLLSSFKFKYSVTEPAFGSVVTDGSFFTSFF